MNKLDDIREDVQWKYSTLQSIVHMMKEFTNDAAKAAALLNECDAFCVIDVVGVELPGWRSVKVC